MTARGMTKRDVAMLILGWFGGAGVVATGTVYQASLKAWVAFWAVGTATGVVTVLVMYAFFHYAGDRVLKTATEDSDAESETA